MPPGNLLLQARPIKDSALRILPWKSKRTGNGLNRKTAGSESGIAKGLSTAFIDRLTLDDKRIDGMIKILHDVVT